MKFSTAWLSAVLLSISMTTQAFPVIAVSESAAGTGDEESKTETRVNITAPDGNAQRVVREEERWVIGVQCEEAGELLRAHLKLGQAGLVIRDVHSDTPAAEAGIIKNDILVSINNKEVRSRDELTKIVLESEGTPLNLSLIRAGDPHSVVVAARKMKVPVAVSPFTTELYFDKASPDEFEGPGRIRLQGIHPGVLIDGMLPHWNGDMSELVRQLRERAAQEGKRTEEESRITITTPEKNRDQQILDLNKTVENLQEQLRTLEKRVAELHDHRKPDGDSPAPIP